MRRTATATARVRVLCIATGSSTLTGSCDLTRAFARLCHAVSEEEFYRIMKKTSRAYPQMPQASMLQHRV